MASLMQILGDFPQRLATFLDRPGFPWRKLFLGFSVSQFFFENFLALRQYRVLQQKKPPKTLQNEISQEVFDKSQAYGRAKARYGFISRTYALIREVSYIQFDLLAKIWAVTGTWVALYAPARFSGVISHSIVFIFTTMLIEQLLELPTSYYYHFILEEKFDFNKQTVRLWIADMLKSQALAAVFIPPFLGATLKIIQVTGRKFFYYLWLFAIFAQVFMITINPIFIQPLFNKLSPLEPGDLKTGVEALAKRLKFPLYELYVIDGSKRSAHSNAYFYGLPWKKHIVIFDTLINQSEPEEVVAVLSHELGHWSLSHTTKIFGINQFQMFYLFALFSIFIDNRSLYESFGFYNERPIIIGFQLFSAVYAPLDAVVKLLMNIISRKFEFEADAFAVRLGYSKELAKSLIKLQIQNLSTMDADWLYASYNYSHPILPERLTKLNWVSEKKGPAMGNGKVIELEGEKEGVKTSGREL